MNTQDITKNIGIELDFLSTQRGFRESTESQPDGSFTIIYQSNLLCIRIQSYHRELYVYASRVDDPEEESSVFNVVNFMRRNTGEKVRVEYYHSVPSLIESYTKQASFVAEFLQVHLDEIETFFSDPEFRTNFQALDKYVVSENPDLF